MIEIVPDKPEITGKLAMSAARVLRDYCRNTDNCDRCEMEHWCEDAGMVIHPHSWNLPEE